jgi:N-acetylmuramoyl-L-alanine amidase
VLIREADEALNFRQRNARARGHDCSLVVEIHHDSYPPRSTAHAMGCYHHRGNRVTRAIGGWVLNHAPIQLRSSRLVCAHDNPTRSDDDWLQNPETVVEAYSASVLLVECAFLSNVQDLQFVLSKRGVDMIAWSIVMGLHKYALIAGA